MPYSQPTLAQAATALASRLNDPATVRWLLPELYGYLREALRWWNASTAHFRDRATFATTIAEPFYDLPTVLPTLRAYTVTTWDLIADLQVALLEPAAPGGTWTGTDQFTLDQLSTAIQRRRDQFLRETGQVVTRSVLPQIIVTPPVFNGRITLDETVLIVRRAAWRNTPVIPPLPPPPPLPLPPQVLVPLQRTDDWSATAYAPTWPQGTARPRAYSVSTTPPLTIQIIDAPQADGTLDLVSINGGAALDPVVNQILGVPDDWAWVVKFGALADLLQGDGLALDAARAAYCESRWQDGIRRATATSVVLAGRINDQPVALGSLTDADAYSPFWQLVNGVPQRLLLAGGNLVASWPPPGATGGPWTISLDVVRNAPMPDLAGDILQISQDVYDSILDYAQHLALFKEGPGQLDLAMALLNRAARAAGIDLNLQQAQQPDRRAALSQQAQDERGQAPSQLPVLSAP